MALPPTARRRPRARVRIRPRASRPSARAAAVRARRGWLSALRVLLCKSVFYGVLVWARRALNVKKRHFPARAVARSALVADPGRGVEAAVFTNGATKRIKLASAAVTGSLLMGNHVEYEMESVLSVDGASSADRPCMMLRCFVCGLSRGRWVLQARSSRPCGSAGGSSTSPRCARC